MNENALSVFIVCSVTISRWHSAITQGTPIWTQSLSVGISRFLVGRVGTKAKRSFSPHSHTPGSCQTWGVGMMYQYNENNNLGGPC